MEDAVEPVLAGEVYVNWTGFVTGMVARMGE